MMIPLWVSMLSVTTFFTSFTWIAFTKAWLCHILNCHPYCHLTSVQICHYVALGWWPCVSLSVTIFFRRFRWICLHLHQIIIMSHSGLPPFIFNLTSILKSLLWLSFSITHKFASMDSCIFRDTCLCLENKPLNCDWEGGCSAEKHCD